MYPRSGFRSLVPQEHPPKQPFWKPPFLRTPDNPRPSFLAALVTSLVSRSQGSVPNVTGQRGYRTMEMSGGSSAPYLACTPCVPLFCILFNRGGSRRASRLPGAGGDRLHCMVEPSPGHIRCRRAFRRLAGGELPLWRTGRLRGSDMCPPFRDPLNRLNAMLSLLHPLDRYYYNRASLRYGVRLSRIHAQVGVLNRLVLNHMGSSTAPLWCCTCPKPF